jgi:hypothetical protein
MRRRWVSISAAVCGGTLAEAVDQLFLQRAQVFFQLAVGQALVERQALLHVRAVGVGSSAGVCRLISEVTSSGCERSTPCPPAVSLDRSLEHLGVHC